MKVLAKAVLLQRNEVPHTRTERKTLADTHHPFLAHPRVAFQSPSKLFLVMDYCCGGELFYHLKCRGRFDEPRARLYAAEIASALSHLHSRKVTTPTEASPSIAPVSGASTSVPPSTQPSSSVTPASATASLTPAAFPATSFATTAPPSTAHSTT